MKGEKKLAKRRKAAALLALFLAALMVLSILAPVMQVFAYGAELTYEGESHQPNGTFSLVQNDQFSIKGQVGFDINGVNRYIVDEVVPFHFTLENKGGPFQGQLQLRVNQAYSDTDYSSQYMLYYVPVELTGSGTTEYDMYVSVPTITSVFSVRLVDEENKVVYSTEVFAKPSDWRSAWTGIVSDHPQELNYWRSMDERNNDSFHTETADYTYTYEAPPSGTFFGTTLLKPEELPNNWAALQNFRILVINDCTTQSFTEEQKQALLEWVESGGLLVLGSGENGSKVLGGLSDVFPVTQADATIQRTTTFSEIHASADLTLSQAQLPNGQVLMEDDGVCLASYEKVGNGTVLLCAWDLGKNPTASMEGMDRMMELLMESCNPNVFSLRDSNYYYQSNISDLQSISKRLAPPDMDIMRILFLGLAGYALLIGPILYIVLKKIDRRERAWVVIPCGAVVVSLLVVGFSSTSKFHQPFLSTASIFPLEEGETTTTANVAVSVMGGKKGSMEVDFGESISPFGMNSYQGYNLYQMGSNNHVFRGLLYGGSSEYQTMTFYNESSWQENSFNMKQPVDLGGTVEVNSTVDQAGLTITVTNNTQFDLQDVVYNIGSSYVKMDYLPAGESGSMTLSMDDQGDEYDNLRNLFPYQDASLFQSSAESERTYTKWRMIRLDENEYKRLNGKLYAFFDQSVWDQTPTINGEEAMVQNMTLLTMEVPLLVEGNANYYLPYGVIYANDVVDDNGTSLLYTPQDMGFYASSAGYATAVFELNELRPTQLGIHWELYGYSNDVLSFELYNQQTGQWELISLDEMMDATPYVSQEGKVQVRVPVEGRGTDIWMDGMRPTISVKGGVQE